MARGSAACCLVASRCAHECSSAKQACAALTQEIEDVYLPDPTADEVPLAASYAEHVQCLRSDELLLEEVTFKVDEEWRIPVDAEGALSQVEAHPPHGAGGPGSSKECSWAASLLALGQRKRSNGDLDGALQTFEKVLVALKCRSRCGLRLRLALFNSRGAALCGKGDSELAIVELEKAYTLREAVALGALQEAVLLSNMGVAHMQLSRDYEGAAKHFRRAYEIRETHSAVCTLGGAILLEHMGDLELERDRVDAAWESFTLALSNLQSMGTMERVEGARLLTKLGTIDRMQRQFKGALQKYTHASSILIRSRATHTGAYARIQGDIGIVRRELGELDAARDAFEKALSIRRQSDSLNTLAGALLLMNYGTTLRMLFDHQGAIEHYSQAQRIREGLGMAASVADVHLLMQISLAAIQLDQDECATESYLEAQRIRKALGLPPTPEHARASQALSSTILTAFSSDEDASPTSPTSC